MRGAPRLTLAPLLLLLALGLLARLGLTLHGLWLPLLVVAKGLLVSEGYMELARAPLPWRLAALAWLLVAAGALVLRG